MSAQLQHPVDKAVFQAQMALTDGICGIRDIMRKYHRTGLNGETETREAMAARIYQLEKKLGIR